MFSITRWKIPKTRHIPATIPEAYVDFRKSLISSVTEDAYHAENTIYCPGSNRIRCYVSGGKLVYQLGFGPSPREMIWGVEAALPPGHYVLNNIFDAVRFRSHAAGIPATIDVETLTSSDLGVGESDAMSS